MVAPPQPGGLSAIACPNNITEGVKFLSVGYILAGIRATRLICGKGVDLYFLMFPTSELWPVFKGQCLGEEISPSPKHC